MTEQEYQARYQRAYQKSVNVKKFHLGNKIVTINIGNLRKAGKKFLVGSAAMVIVATSAFTFNKVADKLEYYDDINQCNIQASMEGNDILRENGLNFIPDENGDWNNSYYQMDANEDDLYSIYLYAGYDEAEKFIIEKLGYAGWYNYLSMNGYFDEFGNYSLEVYINYMEGALYKEMSNSKGLN